MKVGEALTPEALERLRELRTLLHPEHLRALDALLRDWQRRGDALGKAEDAIVMARVHLKCGELPGAHQTAMPLECVEEAIAIITEALGERPDKPEVNE